MQCDAHATCWLHWLTGLDWTVGHLHLLCHCWCDEMTCCQNSIITLNVQQHTRWLQSYRDNTPCTLTYRYYRSFGGACCGTISMEQRPFWEADSSSASQEIPRILWNQKVHYRIHKRPLPVPILIHNNPFHSSPANFPLINVYITLPSTPKSSKWSLSLGCPHKNLYEPLLSPIRAMWPSHLIFFILLPVQYLVRSTSHKSL
jgi:hypothetical protein